MKKKERKKTNFDALKNSTTTHKSNGSTNNNQRPLHTPE